MSNMDIWNKYADIDPLYTKPITGKPYKGTSPNPQYVIQCLTDLFGPVGQGFGWTVVAEAWEPIADETIHWCRIEFWHTDRGNTFDSYGQTRAAYTTNNGKKIVDEDAPKKSLTDAIVKASSHLGIAANIFLGRWDDQKYVTQVNAEFRRDDPPEFNSTGAAERIIAQASKQESDQKLIELWEAEKETLSLLLDSDYEKTKAAFVNRKTQLNPQKENA